MNAPRILAEMFIPIAVDGTSFSVAAVVGSGGAPHVSTQSVLDSAPSAPVNQHALAPVAARRLARTIRGVVAATSAKMERAGGMDVEHAPVYTASLGALGCARVGVVYQDGWFVAVEIPATAPEYLVAVPLAHAADLANALDRMAHVAAMSGKALSCDA